MKIKYKSLCIFFILFSILCCSKSKMLKIEDSNFPFTESIFEREYVTNDKLKSFNIEIVFPEGVSISDIENGSLIVFAKIQDEERSFLLDKNSIERYYYYSYENEKISKLVYKSIDLGNYVKLNSIKVLVNESYTFSSSAILIISNLDSALFFEM